MLQDSLHIQSWREKGKAIECEWISFSVSVTDWVIQDKAAGNRWQDGGGKIHSQPALSPPPRAAWSVGLEEMGGREFSSGQVSRIGVKIIPQKRFAGSKWM